MTVSLWAGLAPVAWQDAVGRRVEVAAAFELEEGGEPGRQAYGFRLGDFDPNRELVVDPVTLVYCGYIGGDLTDGVVDAAVDGLGTLYVTGFAESTEATFPVVVGPDLTYGGACDAFVGKVKADGSGLEYCGYIGGSGLDGGVGIAIDSAGNAYLAGVTASTEATFPVVVGPDLTHNGGNDAFVAKVDPLGTALVYCGYVGGVGGDRGYDIALDGDGNAYVVGVTGSDETTFPVKDGPDLTYNGGANDVFVARVTAAGTGLEYCGYIGGSASEDQLFPLTTDVALDPFGNVFVTGYSRSSEATFPVLVGPDLTHNGLADAFVAKVTAFDLIFADNFVSGDTAAWTNAVP